MDKLDHDIHIVLGQIPSVTYLMFVIQGDGGGVRVLHRRLDRLLLPEDAPRHARPAHQKRHRPDLQQHLRMDARQVPGASSQ